MVQEMAVSAMTVKSVNVYMFVHETFLECKPLSVKESDSRDCIEKYESKFIV